jgi:hypothetical protein
MNDWKDDLKDSLGYGQVYPTRREIISVLLNNGLIMKRGYDVMMTKNQNTFVDPVWFDKNKIHSINRNSSADIGTAIRVDNIKSMFKLDLIRCDDTCLEAFNEIVETFSRYRDKKKEIIYLALNEGKDGARSFFNIGFFSIMYWEDRY